MKQSSGILSLFVSMALAIGLVAACVAIVTALAGGVEIMFNDIARIVLDAVAEIGKAWRGE